MKLNSYADLLRDPRWQKRRLDLMAAAKWTCQDCQNETETLNVHHLFYRKNVVPWEYEDDCFTVVCESCHRHREVMTQKLKEAFAKLIKYPSLFDSPDNLSEWLSSLEFALSEAKAGEKMGTPQFMPQRQWEELGRIQVILDKGGYRFQEAA